MAGHDGVFEGHRPADPVPVRGGLKRPGHIINVMVRREAYLGFSKQGQVPAAFYGDLQADGFVHLHFFRGQGGPHAEGADASRKSSRGTWGQGFHIDGDRFGVWGWSGGGSFTLYSMTSTKEFKAGISVAPVTDWHYYDTKWAEFAMKRPQDNPEGYKLTSIARNAKNLHGRLLLVHGTYDDNVHPQNAWHFIEELIQHNIQFDMMFYPMRKHGIADRAARIHLYNKMLEFWREHL